MSTDMQQQTGWPELRPPGEAWLRRGAARWWWAPLVGGLLWYVIAWLVLRANATSLATVGVLVGVVFLLAAAGEAMVGAFVTGGWRFAHFILSAVLLLAAVWSFVRPVNTFFALASVLGLLLFLQGAFFLMRGIAMREFSPYWWVELLSGLFLTGIGIWVSVSDRVWTLGARAVFILLWVGLMAVFRGTSDIVIAFSMLRFSKKGFGETPGQQPAGEAPYIPGQQRLPSSDASRSQTPASPRA